MKLIIKWANSTHIIIYLVYYIPQKKILVYYNFGALQYLTGSYKTEFLTKLH